jgi:hypothetical protein
METLPNGNKKVTLHELWSAIGGGTKFTHDELVAMAFNQQKERKAFNVQHRDYRFEVPLEDLDLYFRENPLPESAKSLEDQLATLRKRNEELQMDNALLRDELQRASLPVPPSMIEHRVEVPGPNPPGSPDSALRPSGPDFIPPAIPAGDRIPFSKIQDELKKELQSKKVNPVVSRTPFAPKPKTMPPAAPPGAENTGDNEPL